MLVTEEIKTGFTGRHMGYTSFLKLISFNFYRGILLQRILLLTACLKSITGFKRNIQPAAARLNHFCVTNIVLLAVVVSLTGATLVTKAPPPANNQPAGTLYQLTGAVAEDNAVVYHRIAESTTIALPKENAVIENNNNDTVRKGNLTSSTISLEALYYLTLRNTESTASEQEPTALTAETSATITGAAIETAAGLTAGTAAAADPGANVTVKMIVPRNFNSVEEAQAWLDNHHLPFRLTAGQNGQADFTAKNDSRYDCDDYARDFQQQALECGYIVNLCPVSNGRVWGIKVTTLTETHIACFVQIGNTFYYIESVPGMDNSYQLTRLINAD
jgi:hypothetical protein